MTKQRSLFGITPEEELDLQHQGSLRGDQLIGKNGRFINGGNLASFGQSSSEEFTPGREPAEGDERREQETAERTPTQGAEQEKSEKKHHYK